MRVLATNAAGAYIIAAASKSAASVFAATGLLVLTAIAYARFLGAGFAATDSLPLIETSRLEHMTDVGLQFTRPVMAGTSFVLGEVVYRPFVSVTFGVEYALWGLDARGYHLTNLGLHVLSVLGIWFLLTRLGVQRWCALAGAALFALHPLVVASVPVIARRDSVLPVTAFVWGAALLLTAERSCGARRWLALAGSLTLVAIALFSKESAFAALVMLPVLFIARGVGRGGRLRDVLQRCSLIVPFVVLGVGVFALRALVLGELGGSLESDVQFVDPYHYTQTLGAYTRDLAWTFAWFAPSTREIWPRLAGASLLGLVATMVWLPRRQALLALSGVLWIVVFALFSMVIKIATIGWLAYFALVGVALVLGAGVDGAAFRLAAPSSASRWRARVQKSASAMLVGALVVYAGAAFYASALVRDYDQWQLAGDVIQRFNQALAGCVAQAPGASRVSLNRLPGSFEDERFETNLLGVTLLQDYTVASALRLMFPDRTLAVHVSSWDTLHSSADTLQFSCTVRPPDGVELTVSY